MFLKPILFNLSSLFIAFNAAFRAAKLLVTSAESTFCLVNSFVLPQSHPAENYITLIKKVIKGVPAKMKVK